MNKLDIQYTLSPRWVVRREEKVFPYYFAYDIFTDKQYELSEYLFVILLIFNNNTLSINELHEIVEKTFSIKELQSFLLNNEQLNDLLLESAFSSQNEFEIENDEFVKKYDVAIAKFPFEAEIHLTEKCNLRCRHCCYSCGKESLYEEIKFEFWKKTFDEFEKKGLFRLSISGGELFLYPEILRILKDLSTRKFRVELLTNATLIKKEHMQFLNAPNIFLNISLDGAEKEFHEYLRGANTFKKTMDILYKLRDVKAKINISSTIYKGNISQIEGLIKEGIKIKANAINFILLDNIGRAKEYNELTLSVNDKKVVNNKVLEFTKRYSDLIKINYMDPINPQYNYSQSLNIDEKSKIYCSAATVRVAIAADGNVYPCVYGYGFDEMIGGNIKKETMKDIWETSNWDFLRGDIVLSQLDKCKQCSLVNLCALKVCRLRANIYSNDLYGVPHNCLKNE